MKKTLLSLGLGATAMYLLDPEHGSERRTQLMDKISGRLPKTADAINAKAHDLSVKAHDITTQADEKAAEAIATLGPQADDENAVGEAADDAADKAEDAAK